MLRARIFIKREKRLTPAEKKEGALLYNEMVLNREAALFE